MSGASVTVDVTTVTAVPPVWPAWAVPPRAVGEWVALQVELRAADRAGDLVPCRVDPELWFASRATPAETAAQETAAAACTGCLVRSACAAYAVAAGERAGVWGGLRPADRRPS
jgi:hypothetical protein